LEDGVCILFENGHYFIDEWHTIKATVKEINESTEAVLGLFFFCRVLTAVFAVFTEMKLKFPEV
jgi:hypothetical protein